MGRDYPIMGGYLCGASTTTMKCHDNVRAQPRICNSGSNHSHCQNEPFPGSPQVVRFAALEATGTKLIEKLASGARRIFPGYTADEHVHYVKISHRFLQSHGAQYQDARRTDPVFRVRINPHPSTMKPRFTIYATWFYGGRR